MRRSPAHLKFFVIALFLIPELKVRNFDIWLDELIVMGIIGPWSNRSQMAALNCQRQGDFSYQNGQQRQSNGHSDLTYNSQHRHDSYGLWVLAISKHKVNKSCYFQA